MNVHLKRSYKLVAYKYNRVHPELQIIQLKQCSSTQMKLKIHNIERMKEQNLWKNTYSVIP